MINRFSILIFAILVFGVGSANGFQDSKTYLVLRVTDQNRDEIQNYRIRIILYNKLQQEVDFSSRTNKRLVFIDVGTYELEVEAKGFQLYKETVEIHQGKNIRKVVLKVLDVDEKVDVKTNLREKSIDSRNGAFTGFLTKEELDSLPEDSGQLKRALKQKYGRNVEFIVDGFSSNGLPPKSKIASIRVSLTSFDAEYHRLGVTRIEITTKAFKRFAGFASFRFNDESLNGREPLAPIRFPTQFRSFSTVIFGPLWGESTSFDVDLSYSNSFSTKNIIAILPDGPFTNTLRTPIKTLTIGGKIKHNLSRYQTLNLSYSFHSNKTENLGVGGFDLPARAFDFNSTSHQVRYSQTGNVGKRYYNEFRFQFRNEVAKTVSQTRKPAVRVLGAFTDGGAGNDLREKKASSMIADNFLFGIKNHAIKVGALFEYKYQSRFSEQNSNGIFTFSTINDFLENNPATFVQRPGVRDVNLSQYQIGAFVQDDIKVSKSLLVSLGMRYEWQNNIGNSNNFSPRFGVSWSPLKDGSLVLRGGAGFFYNWVDSDLLLNVLSQNSSQIGEVTVLNPGFPGVSSRGITQTLPKSFRQIDKNLRNPYVFISQFGIQKRVFNNSEVRILYSFQKGIHQLRSRNLNAPTDFIRNKPTFGNIFQVESSAFLSRNSVSVYFETKPTEKTYFSTSYRLSRSASDADGAFSLPSNNFDLRNDRAVSSDDRRHRIFGSLGWSPKNGIRLSGSFLAASALPINITTGNDNNNDTIFNDRPLGVKRNSDRGLWVSKFDSSFQWVFKLEKRGSISTNADGSNSTQGRTLIFRADVENILNKTNFNSFVGVESSPLFLQPISAMSPRKINFSLSFRF